MGNDKSKGGRGQPLGTNNNGAQGQRLGGGNTNVVDRRNLVQAKSKIGVSELQKKQKILNVLDQANARQTGDYNKIISQPVQQDLTQSNKVSVADSFNYGNNTDSSVNNNNNNIYMSEPSSKQALAAEQRLKQKNIKKNDKDRKKKTINLVFGDGLKTPELNSDDIKKNNQKYKQDLMKKQVNVNKKANRNESDLVFNDTKAANAALDRLYGKKKTGIKERKQRTMDLLHGDLLSDGNNNNNNNNNINNNSAAEVTSSNQPKYANMDPEVAIVHQALLNVVNSNTSEQMMISAKLLRKILKKIINAKNKDEQDKFGKLRMNQPKIKSALMDIHNGIELLQTMGFSKKKMKTKDGNMDDYMVYDYTILSKKPLKHAIYVIDTYYPE